MAGCATLAVSGTGQNLAYDQWKLIVETGSGAAVGWFIGSLSAGYALKEVLRLQLKYADHGDPKPKADGWYDPENPSLKACIDCGKLVSRKARSCPRCGRQSAVQINAPANVPLDDYKSNDITINY